MLGVLRVVVSMLFLLGAGLAAAPVAAADGPPGSEDGPQSGFEVAGGFGPNGMPFVSEYVILQSPAQFMFGTDRADWTCEVDLGSGPQRGYWRARPDAAFAPCAYGVTFDEPGTVSATMTVVDPSGRAVTTTRELTVTERPTEWVDAGVEGSAVPLPAPDGGGTWVLEGPEERTRMCELVQPRDGTAGSLTCFDDGRYRVRLDAWQGVESRALEVTWVNGAPAPHTGEALAFDQATGDYLPAGPVYAGDMLLLRMQHGDPGARPGGGGWNGDLVRCSADLGDGTTPAEDAYGEFCSTQHAYQRPGFYRIDVLAVDDDGASGARSWTLDVGYRPVDLDVTGPLSDGSTVSARGSLEPTGPVGDIALGTAGGRSVEQAGPVTFGVTGQDVTLYAPARVDGVDGYRMAVEVSRTDGSVRVTVWGDTETVLSVHGAGIGGATVGAPVDGAGASTKPTKAKGKPKAKGKDPRKGKGKKGPRKPRAGRG